MFQPSPVLMPPAPTAPLHQPTSAPSPSWDQSAFLQAMNNFAAQGNSGMDWIFDSGASSHMSASSNMLSNFSTTPLSSIVLGNGTTIPIYCTGQTTIPTPTKQLLLRDVLIAPALIKNLISVRQFTRDNLVSMEFDPFGLSVKDYQTKAEIARFNSSGDLYTLHGAATHDPPTSMAASVDLWHHRLGHPHNATLSSILSEFSINCNKDSHNTSMCPSCQQGKHVRLPFSSSTTVSTFPFELLHCDLWTSPHTSVSGFKYYLVVLDDFTHFVWTFPLRNKSDVHTIFLNFHKYVATHFFLPIKFIQCDNGKEFDNFQNRNFFLQHGILLRFSCPYTSPQNGKAERSLRTINDIIRTLLIHSSMPPKFWAEALRTATYLLNIRPHKSNPNSTPFYSLYLSHPNYSELRVFGCLCFPNTAAISTNKLSPRSIPCVFLGYSDEHKGYRCLDLVSGHVHISRHVTFSEHIFPFSTRTPSQTPIDPSPTLHHPIAHPARFPHHYLAPTATPMPSSPAAADPSADSTAATAGLAADTSNLHHYFIS
jgi:hypothetical protein